MAKPLAGEYKDLPISLIDENSWNPNKMDDKSFNRLCKEVKEVGMIVPIQVVPIETDGNVRYRIIGGAHRFAACKVLDYKFIPAIILEGESFKDEDLQKFLTTRLNVISGKVDPEKLTRMYLEMADKYGKDAMADLMGYTDKAGFQKLVGETVKAAKAQLPKEMAAKLDKAAKEVKTVEGLGKILNTIFREHGDTLSCNYLFFDFGGKRHVQVACSKQSFAAIGAFMERVGERRLKADEVLANILPVWEDILDIEDSDVDASLPAFVREIGDEDEDESVDEDELVMDEDEEGSYEDEAWGAKEPSEEED